MTYRRNALELMLAAAIAPALPAISRADDFPSRVIKLVVPFPPGGPTDVLARIIASSTGPVLNQTIVVENRPGGAAGTVGTHVVVSAAPDGYTLLLTITGSVVIAPSLYKLDYSPLKDLTPVAIVEQSPQVLVVHPSMPDTLAGFIAYAKANPGKLNYGSPSVGTMPHVLMEFLQLVTGIKMTHVPYRGAGPAITDLLGGQLQAMFNNPSVVLAHIASGKLRALGVSTKTRFDQLPNVPTFVEQGYPRLVATEWLGIFAPAGTPAPIVQKLNAAVNSAMKTPEARTSFQKLGIENAQMTPQGFKDFIVAETKKWTEVVAKAGIKGE